MNAYTRFQQRLADLKNAYDRLREATSKTQHDDLEKDGVIQRFEFTFELAWKTLKTYLEDQGFTDTASPKKVLQQAFRAEILENGDIWIDMLDARNSLSHLYRQEMSEKIFEKIKTEYVREIASTIARLEK